MERVRWVVEEFASIDSTNTWLAQRARDGAPEGLVARADFQSAGRGRLDRTWEAPPRSGLLTSLLFRPASTERDLFLYTVIVALAARAALVRLCGVRPDLKWPNDLTVRDAKLGGILAELVTSVDGERGVVVGLGVNLTTDGPPDANGASVRSLAGVTLTPASVLDLLLEEVDGRLEHVREDRGSVITDEFASALSTLGRRVRVETPHDTFVGVAESVDGRGHLHVRHDDRVTVVDVGDVQHVRHES